MSFWSRERAYKTTESDYLDWNLLVNSLYAIGRIDLKSMKNNNHKNGGMDKKETDKDTEFVKEEDEAKRSYIFQRTTITKVAVIIVVAFLILIIIGLVVTGTSFFDSNN